MRDRSIPTPTYFTADGIVADIDTLLVAIDDRRVGEETVLGRRYQVAVAEVQSQPFKLAFSDFEPSLHFDVDDPQVAAALGYLLSQEVDIDSPWSPEEFGNLQLGPEVARFTRERFDAAVRLLDERAPDLLDLARLLVGHVVFADINPREGQTSLRKALGTVFWISPFDSWKIHHFADAIVHESTHQALFLKDMVRGLFCVDGKELRRPAVRVVSTIRGVARPYDLALHAACVDAVLLSLYEALGDLPEIRRRNRALTPALEDLDRKGDVLAPAGRMVLDSAITTSELAAKLLTARSGN